MHGSKDVVHLVEKTPCAIGYSGLAYATDHVKMACIASADGAHCVNPSVATASDGSYPAASPSPPFETLYRDLTVRLDELMQILVPLILPVVVILGTLIFKGGPVISIDFLFTFPVDGMTAGGIFPALLGTVWNVHESDVELVQLRKQVGMVFQRPNPLPISIRDNVLFGYDLHAREEGASKSEREGIMEDALRQVLLWDQVKDRLHRKATELSLEERQTLCIARHIPVKPTGC